MYIIDNFFHDPYEIRNMGLKGKYFLSSDDSWPGYRCNPPENFKKSYQDKVSNILNEKLHLEFLWFHYIDKSWVAGMCHTDSPYKYTCLTYLNLRSPSNSGTEVYEAGCPKNANVDGIIKQTFYRSGRGIMKRWFYKKDMEKYIFRYLFQQNLHLEHIKYPITHTDIFYRTHNHEEKTFEELQEIVKELHLKKSSITN